MAIIFQLDFKNEIFSPLRTAGVPAIGPISMPPPGRLPKNLSIDGRPNHKKWDVDEKDQLAA